MRLQIGLFCCCISIVLYAQNGKVFEGKTLKSGILGKNVPYSIYLPADYETSNRTYPVVYLLHGYSDNETAWVQFGAAHYAVDQLVKSGEINPVILVMPFGDLDWYTNDHSGKVRWMDMFIKELIPHIDASYRTKGTSEYRAISGLSMGGYGALLNSLKNLKTFSACAALSAAVWTEEDITSTLKDDRYQQPWWPKGTLGKDRLTAHWKANSILDIVASMPKDSIQKVRWYLDCGDKDFLTVGNAQLHIAFHQKKIDHEYHVRAGYHNWDYWRSGIYDALRFICKGFDRR